MKVLLAALCLAAAVFGAALLLARHERYEWTTDSPRAVAELEAALEAAGKLYEAEAIHHLEKALEADPDFAVARVYLIFYLSRHGADDPRRIHELLQELEARDLNDLNPRERTLVEFFLARAGGREDAADLLRDYLAEHPDDPYVLDFQCTELAYLEGGGDDVEACLQHLIEVDPNRVAAQNLLAYMAMNEGDFDRAEEQFEIYRFLAPDQANPHDSMAELLMVTGRYPEARSELRRAVALKPDFCPSWRNLVLVSLLENDFEAARGDIAEARRTAACGPLDLARMTCGTEAWADLTAGAWDDAWNELSACTGRRRGGPPPPPVAGNSLGSGLRVADTVRSDLLMSSLAGLAATAGGHGGDAEQLVRALAGGGGTGSLAALHVSGLVELAAGRPQAATERLARVDDHLVWGAGMGVFKLLNRLHDTTALAAAGDEAAARRSRAGMAEVNRAFAADPPLPTLEPLPALESQAPPQPGSPRPPRTPSTAPAAPSPAATPGDTP